MERASFAAMVASDAQQPLDGLLAGVDARVRHLAFGGTAGGGYSALPSADRVAIAGALGLSPFSREARAIFARVGASIPALGDRWSAGADHLELGCGVGNALLSFALEFPRLRAVGVEIDAALVAEARRRAGVLGLEDRVRVRHLDAAQLDDEECFDTAQWSQLFFPTASRRAVLLALRRALRPGGVVVMPTLPDEPAPTPAGSLKRLLIASWGVPAQTESALREELQDAGFELIEARALPPRPLILTEGLALARRP